MQKFFPCIEKKVTKRTEKLKLSFLLSLSHILRQLLKNSMQRQALMASKCLIDFFCSKGKGRFHVVKLKSSSETSLKRSWKYWQLCTFVCESKKSHNHTTLLLSSHSLAGLAFNSRSHRKDISKRKQKRHTPAGSTALGQNSISSFMKHLIYRRRPPDDKVNVVVELSLKRFLIC